MTVADSVSAKPRILVIEDEPSVAAFLRTALERRGYDVDALGFGRGGIAIARDERFSRRDVRFSHSGRHQRR